MMEVENTAETVNLKETPPCLSTNISRDFKSNSEECKLLLELYNDSNKINPLDHSIDPDPISRCTRSHLQDSIPELPNSCQESLLQHEADETKTFPKRVDTVYRSQVIRDNMKAISEKYETRLMNSDPNEDMDECGQCDAQGSPAGDVSPSEETSEIPTGEVLDDSSSFDARRTRRKNKRKLVSDFCCPVCGITVREPELAAHYAQEVEKLTKIPGNLMKLRRRRSDGISTTFVQVKSNRENRLTAKVAKYAAKASKEIQCPICKLRISGCEEDVNKHVALCVQNEDDYDEHIVVDDDEEDYESFEEYEVLNSYHPRVEPLGRPTPKRTRYDENEEVEVDIDDTKTYGEPQYLLSINDEHITAKCGKNGTSELDVITNSTDGDSEELRKAVLGNPSAQPHVLESRKWADIVDANKRESLSDSPTSQLPTGNFWNEDKMGENKSDENGGVSDQTVTSLKEKIKDLEDQNRSVKCLICMESYTKPVVSTTCWHVHCEECWLMTMGVKKLCPQCNMIVFPSDLRKIYL